MTVFWLDSSSSVDNRQQGHEYPASQSLLNIRLGLGTATDVFGVQAISCGYLDLLKFKCILINAL